MQTIFLATLISAPFFGIGLLGEGGGGGGGVEGKKGLDLAAHAYNFAW